ncbi:unnamed protein product [Durusdinium trenchii]|uniref:Uncharacterized protein n=1 Tax=Durusdinium trenchii TaxID=1381693 RepID=A0ABP0KX85_9DINO
MDGVVWVLAQAPGAFTMLGLLERQTVLMHAAQDADQHDKASISFKELVQLYLVMQMPLTTVDPYGWNAEMLAARKLRRNHVEVLRHEVVGTWYRDYKEACKKWLSTSDFMSNALSDGYVNASLMFARLARILLVVFVILLMLLIVDGCQSFCGCQWDPIWRIKTEVQKCGWDYDDAGFLLLVDMSFRVLWLLMINTAFLQVPPLLTTGYENQVLPGVGNIPSVSIWNPLPMTAVVIGCLSLVSATLWAYFDYCNAVPNWAADEKTAEWAARSSLDTASYQHSTRPTKFASTATTSAKMETSSSTIPASTTASYPPGNKPTWSSSFGLICDEKEVQKKLKKPIPEDRFQDPTSHFLGCVCIFVLVTSLMVIYIETILQPLEMNPKRMGLWLGALLVQVRITLDDKTLKEEEGYNKTPPTKKHQASQREAYYYSQLQLCEHQATDLASDFESEGDEHGAKKTPEHSDAQLLRHWLRWACCMVTPENREMWGLHLSARRWNSSITREAEAEAKVSHGKAPCFRRWIVAGCGLKPSRTAAQSCRNKMLHC